MRTLSQLGLSFFLLMLIAFGCKTNSQESDLTQYPRSSFDLGGVSFSLADLPNLDQVDRDSVGWSQLLPQTEQNAPIVYYFLNDERTLSAPHIRLEYIDKSLQGMGKVEDIHNWLKSLFLNDTQNGKLITEEDKVSTMDGQEVTLLEIERPETQQNDSVSLGLKMMAWAYIDHQDRFVACNFSATHKDDFDRGIPVFKDLIRSYKDE